MSTPEVSMEELQSALAGLETPPPTVTIANAGPAVTVAAKTATEGAEVHVPTVRVERPNPLAMVHFVDPDQVKKDVDIDITDLDNETRRQSATYLFHAQNASKAKAQAKRVKNTAEILESRLYSIHREELGKDGKKVTEAMVDAAVKNDRLFYEMKQKVIDSELIADLARDTANSLEQRKDMLVQLTVDRRKEREGELRIGAAKDAVQGAREDVLKLIAGQQNTAVAAG
jgi:hypothetical protein